MRAHVAKPESKANGDIGSGAFVTGRSPIWEGKAVQDKMYDVAIGRRIEGRDDVSRTLPTRPNQGRRQRGRLIQFIAL